MRCLIRIKWIKIKNKPDFKININELFNKNKMNKN